MQYFGSNTVEGFAESWVEFEMSWVEVGARFSNTRFNFVNHTVYVYYRKNERCASFI